MAQQGMELEVRRDLASQRLNKSVAAKTQASWYECPWSAHMLQPCVSLCFALGLIPISVVVCSFFSPSIPL